MKINIYMIMWMHNCTLLIFSFNVQSGPGQLGNTCTAAPSELGKSNLKQSITHKLDCHELLGIGCLLWNVDGGGHCCDVVVCK